MSANTPPTSAKARGRKRISQATGAMIGASLLLTGGVAVLINAGLDETPTASGSTSTTTATTEDSGSIQVQSGSGQNDASSGGS